MSFVYESNKMNSRYGWLLAKCDQCGDTAHIAVGFCASEQTLAVKISCLIKMGWQAAPLMLCRLCVHRKKLSADCDDLFKVLKL